MIINYLLYIKKEKVKKERKVFRCIAIYFGYKSRKEKIQEIYPITKKIAQNRENKAKTIYRAMKYHYVIAVIIERRQVCRHMQVHTRTHKTTATE